MRNFEKLQYTFRHRQAFRFVLESKFRDCEHYEELLERAKVHDLDKSLFLTIGDRDAASAFHRANSSHHMENDMPKTEVDLYEAVIDYECAGYTKPDKPLNAYDAIRKYEKNNSDGMLAILHGHGMDRSYDNLPTDPDWLSFSSSLPDATESNVLEEIELFRRTNLELAARILACA